MRLALAAILALVLSACAPAFQPQDGAAPGVRLTALPIDGATTYRVEVAPAVERLFLRFVGTDLEANAPECELVAGALECIIGAVANFYEVTIGGQVANDVSAPFGVACRAECYALFLEVP